MDSPTTDPLARLSWFERATFRFARLMALRLKPVSVFWASKMAIWFVRLSVMRRVRVSGMEELADIGPKDSVLLVANHRSFFDFYVVAATLFLGTPISRDTLFPVRSNFFYDHVFGPLVNMVMSGMQMFPPMVRGERGREFNRYSMSLLSEIMRRPGTVVGMHPEGTRSKDGTPYHLLKARPGVGQLVLEAPDARVVPVFICGLSNSIPTEVVRNWLSDEDILIDVVIGRSPDFTALRAEADKLVAAGLAYDDEGYASPELRRLWHEVADGCLQSVARLGEAQRSVARAREVAELGDDAEVRQRLRA